MCPLNQGKITYHILIHDENFPFLPEKVKIYFNEIVDYMCKQNNRSKMLNKGDLALTMSSKYKLNLNKNIQSTYYIRELLVNDKKNIVFENYPELKNITDGLAKTEKESEISINGFRYKNHYLVFPEIVENNFELVKWFIDNNNTDSDIKISFEYDVLGIQRREKGLEIGVNWYGPKVIKQIIESNKKKEYTVYVTPSANYDYFDKTEFYFSKQNSKWHLQIEESIPCENFSISHQQSFRGKDINYFTKYVHAIVSSNAEKCFHIDGAIRNYFSFKNWNKRNKLKLAKDEVRNLADYEKLFRIDSKKGINDYHEIIGLFLKKNHHVKKFFEGESGMSEKVCKWL